MKNDWNNAEIALQELLRGIEPAKAAILIAVCQRYSLDPVLKHAVLVSGNLYVTRDGLLQVAHSSGQLDGIEVTVSDNGEWAEAVVYRKDMSHPFRYRVYRKEYDTGKGAWATHPSAMLIKVAEVFAIRRAFPVGLTPIEEMECVIEHPSVAQPAIESRAHALPPPEVTPRKPKSDLAQIRAKLEQHAEKIGISFSQIISVWEEAKADGWKFVDYARRVLKCESEDAFLQFSLNFEKLPEE